MGELETPEAVAELQRSGKEGLVVVYAPWCQYCQGMEEAYSQVSEAGMPTYKFRGDEQREFVSAEMNTESFPTINYLTADGKFIKYESDERSVEALAAFAKSPPVAA